MLQKALGCLFVFGIAPVGIGGLWTKGIGQKREKILTLYLAGFLSELAVFQLIAVPVMVKEVYGMNLLVYLTTAVLAVLAKTKNKHKSSSRQRIRQRWIQWTLG